MDVEAPFPGVPIQLKLEKCQRFGVMALMGPDFTTIKYLGVVSCRFYHLLYPIIHLRISCIMKSGSIQKLHEKGDAQS